MQSALAESLSVSNIIKNDSSLSTYFAEQFASLTPMKMVIALLFGLAVGMLIAFVYKKCYRGVLYSPTFSLTLIMLTLITTPVVMCIKSDIALSMGMVGALSIVRFRTAVKDPMDTAYMFWALTMGILLGAELYVIAVVVALGIAVILFGLTFMKFRNPNAYLLVLHYDDDAEHDILSLLRRTVKQHRLRSKTVTRRGDDHRSAPGGQAGPGGRHALHRGRARRHPGGLPERGGRVRRDPGRRRGPWQAPCPCGMN